jgi:diketogulonate reductase-like aldo/keto reductase
MPYDPKLPIADQVRASIESSLFNLRTSDDPGSESTNYLDALVLHSPLPTMQETLEAWRACEEYVPHKIRNLGISNCWLPVLTALERDATIKPAVVQNRFYPETQFDTALRAFCREKSIVYQSFWTLSANPALVWSAEVGGLAHRAGISPQAALYCLVLALGNTVVLDGTTKQAHMVADIEALRRVGDFAATDKDAWTERVSKFKARIGELEG